MRTSRVNTPAADLEKIAAYLESMHGALPAEQLLRHVVAAIRAKQADK